MNSLNTCKGGLDLPILYVLEVLRETLFPVPFVIEMEAINIIQIGRVISRTTFGPTTRGSIKRLSLASLVGSSPLLSLLMSDCQNRGRSSRSRSRDNRLAFQVAFCSP